MKKTSANLLVLMICFVVAGAFSACSTNHSVTNGGLIQKRKYNKGYYWHLFEKKSNFEAVDNISRIKTDADLFIDPVDIPEYSFEYFAPTECLYASNADDDILIVQQRSHVSFVQNNYSKPVKEITNISVKHRNRMLENEAINEKENFVSNETQNESKNSHVWFYLILGALLFGFIIFFMSKPSK